MFSEMKKEIIEAGILLDRYELVSLTGPPQQRTSSASPPGCSCYLLRRGNQ